METKKYFTHINALRGLAILLVFLYHLREQWCPQGFLGVDAFFVISGYFLIPPLLSISYKGGKFSWWGYFKGKATRILPPLIVMTLVALLASIPIMIASDLINTAGTARTVIAGLSNIYFGLASTDYFAPSVKENIFLHTWYIAVLIQVLVVAPFLCRLLSLIRPAWGYLLLSMIGTVSLFIYFQHWLPIEWQNNLPGIIKDGGELGSVYYMTAGRLWEIIAGAFIAFLPVARRRTSRSLLLTLGLLLLIVPCFWPQNARGLALFAVIGTALIIRYGESTHFSLLLENRTIMWLGTVSFSLYLIHWPIMALSRYALMRDFNIFDCACVSLLSLGLAWLLYQGIEKRRPRFPVIVLVWALTLALTFGIRRTEGLKNYVNVGINSIEEHTSTDYKGWEFAPESSWVGPYPRKLVPVRGHYGDVVLDKSLPQYGHVPILQIGDKRKQPNFILLGDSYANALFPGFDMIAKREGWSGLYLNLYVTPFWNRLNCENPDEESRFSQNKAESLIGWLKKNPHIRFVIVQQRWHRRFIPSETWTGDPIRGNEVWSTGEKALTDFCKRVKEIGKEVIFFMPTPEANVPDKTQLMPLIKRSRLWYRPNETDLQLDSNEDQYEQRNGRIRQILTHLRDLGLCKLIDPAPALFRDGKFNPIDGDELIVYDHGHMTPYGAEKLIESLRVQIRDIVAPSSQSNETGNQTVPPASEHTN